MATVSASSMYIVVTYISYCGISGDLDSIYLDKAEAEKAADQMNTAPTQFSTRLKYQVMDLYDYIQELKSEARSDGAQDERNLESGNW
jgi:hypothetical protein